MLRKTTLVHDVGGGVKMAKVAISVIGMDGGINETDVDH